MLLECGVFVPGREEPIPHNTNTKFFKPAAKRGTEKKKEAAKPTIAAFRGRCGVERAFWNCIFHSQSKLHLKSWELVWYATKTLNHLTIRINSRKNIFLKNLRNLLRKMIKKSLKLNHSSGETREKGG